MSRVFVIALLALSSVAGKSLIQPVLNPGCKACLASEDILVYIKVWDTSEDYVIHQVWDFTGHVPSILYVVGLKNSTLEVEWDGNKPTNIVTSNTYYSFATILTNLIEYNDVSDSAFFDYSEPYRPVSLRNVTWVLDESVLADFKAKLRVRGALPPARRGGSAGVVEIKLLLLPYNDRAAALPRLYHTARTTLVDVSLAGLATSRHYSSARYALRYAVVAEDVAGGKLLLDVRKTVDDEFTPGVFETINLVAPANAMNASGGFLQYRPVAYTARQRSVASSVTAGVYSHNRTTIPPNCLLGRYFARFDQNSLLVQEAVASFGQSGDGFYKQTNFTAWSHSVGCGDPPKERASIFVMVIMGLSIATPLVGLALAVLVSRRVVRLHRARARLNQEA